MLTGVQIVASAVAPVNNLLMATIAQIKESLANLQTIANT